MATTVVRLSTSTCCRLSYRLFPDSSFDVSTALGQDEADSSEGDDSTDEDEFPFLPLSSDASVDGEYSAEQTSSDEGDF